MAVNRQKLKLLYLMRMLEEETDAEQGLTMSQILERLEAQGITAERKGILREVSGHPVHDHADAGLMELVDQVTEIVGGAEA